MIEALGACLAVALFAWGWRSLLRRRAPQARGRDAVAHVEGGRPR